MFVVPKRKTKKFNVGGTLPTMAAKSTYCRQANIVSIERIVATKAVKIVSLTPAFSVAATIMVARLIAPIDTNTRVDNGVKLDASAATSCATMKMISRNVKRSGLF